MTWQPRPPEGLYDPTFEHDACGVAFVVDMKGRRSHSIVERGLDCLCNLEHRGAAGSESNTGDGAGLLIQVPDAFYRAVAGFDLPPAGDYATGIAFLPADPAEADRAADAIGKIATSEGLTVIGWRDMPVDDSMIGATAKAAEPSFRQVFLSGAGGARPDDAVSGMALERKAFVVRKRVEHELEEDIYFPSLSARTIVYKGMLTSPRLRHIFDGLGDDRVQSDLALVDSRFSTNTFLRWPVAPAYRHIPHHG